MPGYLSSHQVCESFFVCFTMCIYVSIPLYCSIRNIYLFAFAGNVFELIELGHMRKVNRLHSCEGDQWTRSPYSSKQHNYWVTQNAELWQRKSRYFEMRWHLLVDLFVWSYAHRLFTLELVYVSDLWLTSIGDLQKMLIVLSVCYEQPNFCTSTNFTTRMIYPPWPWIELQYKVMLKFEWYCIK